MVDYINSVKKTTTAKKTTSKQYVEFKRSTVYGYQQYQPIVNLLDLKIQPNPGAGLIGVQHQTTNNVPCSFK